MCRDTARQCVIFTYKMIFMGNNYIFPRITKTFLINFKEVEIFHPIFMTPISSLVSVLYMETREILSPPTFSNTLLNNNTPA